MDVTGVLSVAATCLYAGFQWTVRLVVYPQLSAVPTAAFVDYERSHQRLISWAVRPLFGVFGICAVVAVVVLPCWRRGRRWHASRRSLP